MNIANNQTNAIILALASDSSITADTSNGSKSLVTLNGRPAISYLADNLMEADSISRVILVGDESAREAVPNIEYFVDIQESETESILAGIREAGDGSRCLLMTGDIPLVSSESIDDFLGFAPAADVIYPIVEKSDIKADFPDKTAYYVATKQGKFTGSGTLLFRPEVALARQEFLRTLLNARKNPTALLGILGAGLAMKIMFSKIDLQEFEQALSQSFDIDCRVFVSHFPELFISLDSAEDITLVEQALNHTCINNND